MLVFLRLNDARQKFDPDHHLLVAQDTSTSRRFLLLDAHLFLNNESYRSQFTQLHEVLGDAFGSFRLTFDIDVEAPLMPDSDPECPSTFAGPHFQSDFESAVCEVIQEFYPRAAPVDTLRFVWMQSMGNPRKLSYHLVVHQALVCKWSQETATFYDLLQQRIRCRQHFGGGPNPFLTTAREPFDRALCRRIHTLRMNRMCKRNETYPMVPIDYDGKEDRKVSFAATLSCGHRFSPISEQILGDAITNDPIALKHFPNGFYPRVGSAHSNEAPAPSTQVQDALQVFRTSPVTAAIADAFEYRETVGHLVCLNRTHTSTCPLCHTTHTHDHAFLRIARKIYGIYFHCYRARAHRVKQRGLFIGLLPPLSLQKNENKKRSV